uniref:Uncharacterized protein n=1 Tax=Panagrolaimus davidi TaxID=227884 RepID=A0A914QVB5_9BILA
MLELIPEALENVAAALRYHGKSIHPKMEEIKTNSTNLIKFMLSGRKPLNSALRYFSRADSIALWNDFFVVTLKNFSTDRFNTFNKHYFAYDFILIKPLLNALSQSNGALEIHESLEFHEQNVVVEAILDFEYKTLTFFAKLSPQYYFNMVAKQREYKKIRAAYEFENRSPFYDIFAIPASCHEITTSLRDVNILKIPEGSEFPAVKELNIFWMDLGDKTVSYTQQSSKIAESFPNLEKLYLVFNLHNNNYRNDNRVQYAISSLHSKAFEIIPAQVRGVIVYGMSVPENLYKNMVQQLRNDPSFKIDSEKKLITKTLLIHDGLFVIFNVDTDP